MSDVALIGLGDMGLAIGRRLIDCGHSLRVWNRTPGKTDILSALGARPTRLPRDAFADSEVTILCLSSHVAVAEIVEGPGGLASADLLHTRRVVVDCSTGAPAAATVFSDIMSKTNSGWVDAPVSGGVGAAQDGQLVMFLGGPAQDVRDVERVLGDLSARRTHFGPSGAGQIAKLCNQIIVASNILAIAETVAVAEGAGIDAKLLPGALAAGFADSVPLQVFGPRMARRQFTPRLGSIGLMAKDARLALDLAHRSGVATNVLASAVAAYDRVNGLGGLSAHDDLSRLVELFSQDPAASRRKV